MEAIRTATSRHQRTFEWQAFDPAVHGDMQGVTLGCAADDFGNVARDVHAAHDPDFLDLGGEYMNLVRAGHAPSRILLLLRHRQEPT
jgi:hypothetical protein